MWFLLYCKNYSLSLTNYINYSCYISILYTNTLKQTKIINITADDATPNPLADGEEALFDAGEEAAATAMEA